ncbi:MAG: hypothetical protein ACI9XP_000494 [Lentimonas sp.]|jgi:uncharacterized protein (DUF2141 family)
MCFRIILIVSLLLSGCAQVGYLTGGEQDVSSPRPIDDQITPPNETTNFTARSIEIPFDEFFKLRDPSSTVVVIPPDLKPELKIKGKKLLITWEDTLQENTTYAIYLNGTVQDLTENNDSLLTYVFSTGAKIDSLSARFSVQNSFTNQAESNYTVALYKDGDSLNSLPSYFGQTDRSGSIELKYLKTGSYYVLAFLDNNKDLKRQADEYYGYKSEIIFIDSNFVDSLPIHVFIPEKKPQITSLSFNPPGSFWVSSNNSLEDAAFVLNGQQIISDDLYRPANDSVLIPFDLADSSSLTLIVNTPTWTDTITKRVTQKEKTSPLKIVLAGEGKIHVSDKIKLYSSSLLDGINVPNFSVRLLSDSSNVALMRCDFSTGILELETTKSAVGRMELTILPRAVYSGKNTNKDTIKIYFERLNSDEYGSILLKTEDFTESIIVDIIKDKKTVKTIALEAKSETKIDALLPGNYTFRVIVDENKNGRWDAGDIDQKRQPEKVVYYTEENRLRPSWELEVVLKAP